MASITGIDAAGRPVKRGSKVKPVKYRARYRTPDGASRSKTFERKIDAERHLTAVEHSKLNASYIDPKLGRTTVSDYWALWSPRQPWRASSRRSITSLFTKHVLPAFGDRQLASLRRGDVETWAAALPLSGQTARQASRYLSTMLESAVADELIVRNPAHGAKLPRIDAGPIVPFTADEVDALRAAAPDWFDAAFTLGLGAGLRQSEATGLTLDRVDFLRRTITVDRQMVATTAGVPTLGPLKTERSYRTVPLADFVVAELARHVEVHGVGIDGLVLHRPGGEALSRSCFGDVWRQLRERAGCPTARFHDARHTFASVLLAGGVSVPAAAEYLGHSPSVLLRTYAHLMPGDHDRARSVVEAAFALDTNCVTTVSRGLGG